jgi:hypothetical protein
MEPGLLARWGQRWRVYNINDVAVLPHVFLIATILGFFFMPIQNTEVRTQEHELISTA